MEDHRLLLVDDEQGLITMLKTVLEKEGFSSIDSALTGETALQKTASQEYDLIVLDVMLPDMHGFELCRKIRTFSFAPILFLTAKTSDLDKLTGLGAGGDDYMTKPFNPLEVAARIKARFRREEVYQKQSSQKKRTLMFDKLVIDSNAASVALSGRNIELTAKEFELLLFLAEHPNQIFTATQLYEQVWGMDSLGDDKTVTVYIMRLRKKLETDPKHPKLLLNLRGIGYKLNVGGGK